MCDFLVGDHTQKQSELGKFRGKRDIIEGFFPLFFLAMV
jgi:hypothetical protein